MIKNYNYINAEDTNIDYQGKDVIIWGISSSGLEVFLKMRKQSIDVMAFTDSFVSDDDIEFVGRPIIKPAELSKAKSGTIVYISTTDRTFQIQIMEQLCKFDNITIVAKGVIWGPGEYDVALMRAKEKKAENEIEYVRKRLCDEKSETTFRNLLNYRITNDPNLLYEIYEKEHPQYFPTTFIKPNSKEIFVDAGAYDGDTTMAFVKWVNGSYDKVYVMEPDELMFEATSFLLTRRHLKNVECYNKGAYSRSDVLSFSIGNDMGSSSISETGEFQIETISIDEMLDGCPATYIKMDIEGSEMEALHGCENTIKHFRPKLAISIYHHDDDLWEIPYYIMNNYPFYKIFIRHYTQITTETIMYAIPE